MNGQRRGIHKVLDTRPAAFLKHVSESHQIGVDVRLRVLGGVPHTCLSSQVYHDSEPRLLEQRLHHISVTNTRLSSKTGHRLSRSSRVCFKAGS